MTVKIIRHFLVVSLAWFFLAAIPASAQGILPVRFDDWTSATATGTTLRTKMTFSPVMQEYGLVSGEDATYSRGTETMHVDMYKMKDPSGAYGLYSYLRAADMAHFSSGEHSVVSDQRALLLTGNVVLDVTGKNLPKYSRNLESLVAYATKFSEQGPLPSLTEHLPSKGFVERSDKYVLGPVTLNEVFPLSEDDWLGFSHGAEAEVAKYNINGHDVRLLIADFPTPQVAQKRLADLQQVYHFNPKNPDANSTPLFAKRSITLLAIVSGAKTQAEADELLSQISSGSEVVWNEPTFQFKEPSIGAMIVGSIIGAGVLCMFAVVAGVAFGGFRLVVKRYFPDKVFDRSATMQVLQLGLGSKPINSDDFYGSGPSK